MDGMMIDNQALSIFTFTTDDDGDGDEDGKSLKPCSHQASVLTLVLMLLNKYRNHLNLDTSVDADPDACCL